MANVERVVTGSSGKNVNIAQSILPMIQAYTDMQKYKMQKQDEAKKLALMYALQGGWGKLATGGQPIEYGGINLEPFSIQEHLQATGKDVEAEKAFSEIALNKAKLAESQAFTGGQGAYEGWEPTWMDVKTPGGSTISMQKKATAAPRTGLAGFFQSRSAAPQAATASPAESLTVEEKAAFLKAKKIRPDLSDDVVLQWVLAQSRGQKQ